MPNGTTYAFEDISNSEEVPDSRIEENTGQLYFPLARLSPGRAELERLSLTQLLAFVLEHQNLDGRVQDNTQNIGNLVARIAAIEQALHSTHPVTPPATAGHLRFGIRNTDGNLIGTEGTAAYPALPATVAITFPAATATTDSWYLILPADVTALHIWNEGLTRVDEIAEWSYDANAQQYSFTGLTPGFTGRYSIAITSHA